MTLLNEANRIYLGTAQATAVYAGADKVWPPTVFATFEPTAAVNVTLSAGNLMVTNFASGMVDQGAKVLPGKTSGKFYYEATLTNWATGGSVGIGGIGTITTIFGDMQNGATGGVMLQSAGGQIWQNFTIPANIGARATGDEIGFAVDLDNRTWWCCLIRPTVGNWNNSGTANPATNTGGIALPSGILTPFCTFGGVSTGPGNQVTTNFGDTGFSFIAPSGFTPGWPP